MTNCKLLQLEPTPEMVEAAEDAYMPFGDMDLAIRMAILAAPDVQGEKPRQYPIGPLTYEKVFKVAGLTDLSDMKAVLDAVESALSASAAPAVQGGPVGAEQQPLKSSLALDAATHLTNWLDMDLCECEGGHTCGYNEVQRTRDALLAAAEQQLNFTQLVEALEEKSK